MYIFRVGFRGLFFLCVIFVALGLLGYREYQLLPDGRLHAHFLSVDQGDSTLLTTPSGKQILIDGGPNMDTLEYLGKYLPYFDRKIELLILTHPHEDHLTALPEILRRYTIESVLMSGSDHVSGRYSALIHELLLRKIPVILASPGRKIHMGDGTLLEIVWPEPAALRDLDTNNSSTVVRVLYGPHAILLTGDIEKEAEAAILQSGRAVRADILKVAHHGSNTSSSTGFLLAVQPRLGIVSLGLENSFGHPHSAIVKRYEKMGIPLRFTAKEGTISLTFTR